MKDKIRTLRLRAGLTQAQLAENPKINPKPIHNNRNGDNKDKRRKRPYININNGGR